LQRVFLGVNRITKRENMKIEILGMGCPKCKLLYQNVKKAVEEKCLLAEVVKVEDINKITDYGVMMAPALVIDGEVKSSGKALSIEEIKKWLV
jgi:small redox-active disulfide protein 2